MEQVKNTPPQTDTKKATPNEGGTTKAIEQQTAQIPSKMYLCAALTVLGAAVALKCMGHRHTALLVGQWASPLLLFGVYNKIVKTHGHDQES